jgi:hypothetical protein
MGQEEELEDWNSKVMRSARAARNPALTIQPPAWRTAQHLAENWKAITR